MAEMTKEWEIVACHKVGRLGLMFPQNTEELCFKLSPLPGK